MDSMMKGLIGAEGSISPVLLGYNRPAGNFQVAGSNLTAGHLQATLSNVLSSTQPPTLRWTGNE